MFSSSNIVFNTIHPRNYVVFANTEWGLMVFHSCGTISYIMDRSYASSIVQLSITHPLMGCCWRICSRFDLLPPHPSILASSYSFVSSWPFVFSPYSFWWQHGSLCPSPAHPACECRRVRMCMHMCVCMHTVHKCADTTTTVREVTEFDLLWFQEKKIDDHLSRAHRGS